MLMKTGRVAYFKKDRIMKTVAKSILFISVLSMAACGSVENASTPSEVLGSGDTEDVLKHGDWSKNATIYEVNLRQHTAEGTLEAFAKDLPRLQQLGWISCG